MANHGEINIVPKKKVPLIRHQDFALIRIVIIWNLSKVKHGYRGEVYPISFRYPFVHEKTMEFELCSYHSVSLLHNILVASYSYIHFRFAYRIFQRKV